MKIEIITSKGIEEKEYKESPLGKMQNVIIDWTREFWKHYPKVGYPELNPRIRYKLCKFLRQKGYIHKSELTPKPK